MTALTATQIAKLNKMNRASQDATIGTRIAALESGSAVFTSHLITSGSVTVSSGQASASAVVITVGTTSKGFIVQANRSGSIVPGVKVTPSATGSLLTIESSASASWVIAAGDIVNWITF